MTDTKTVLVVGAAGNLGYLITKALLAQPDKFAVRAAARDTSAASNKHARLDGLRADGATLFDVDLASGKGLDAACDGADVVISTVQGGPDVIIDGQSRMLEACVRAGVGRLVPSDYSMNPFALSEGENMNSDWRRAFASRVRTSGIGYSFMLNGAFMEVIVSPFMQLIDTDAGTLSYWGDGDVPLDMTSMPDVAAFLAAAILDPDTLNRPIEVAGDRLDIPAMAAAYQDGTGKPLKLVRLGSIDEGYVELERRKRETSDPMALLPLMYALPMMSGKARLPNAENARFPSVQPKTLRAFLSADRSTDRTVEA